MSDPYLGEIRMTGFNFAPLGWAFCDGSLLPIQSYTALFSLLGTQYGGNGTTTFALPDMRSRVPVHQGSGSTGTPYVMGQTAGVETVTLTPAQMPSHTHPPGCNTTATVNTPANQVWAPTAGSTYSNAAPTQQLSGEAIGNDGGGQAHDNMPPFTVVNFIIALQGIYPSRD